MSFVVQVLKTVLSDGGVHREYDQDCEIRRSRLATRRQNELPALFSTAVGPVVALGPRSNSFPVVCKSYKELELRRLYFQRFADGTLVALEKGRRSGAQRGASENNFGQRFSVSTPCFIPQKRTLRQPSPFVRTHVSGSFFSPFRGLLSSRPLLLDPLLIKALKQ